MTNMAKKTEITVRDVVIKTMKKDDIDYICITDIARQKNPVEPKDVVKNWMRQKNTLEYLGLWEKLNNPQFKGVEFDPLLAEAGNNSFTMSPSRWVELTAAIGIITKNGAGGGTFAQRNIAFKFASWVSVEFELYLVSPSKWPPTTPSNTKVVSISTPLSLAPLCQKTSATPLVPIKAPSISRITGKCWMR